MYDERGGEEDPGHSDPGIARVGHMPPYDITATSSAPATNTHLNNSVGPMYAISESCIVINTRTEHSLDGDVVCP